MRIYSINNLFLVLFSIVLIQEQKVTYMEAM